MPASQRKRRENKKAPELVQVSLKQIVKRCPEQFSEEDKSNKVLQLFHLVAF